jgi:hypothetical protein
MYNIYFKFFVLFAIAYCQMIASFAASDDEGDKSLASGYVSVFEKTTTYIDSSRRHPPSPTIKLLYAAPPGAVDQITQKLGATSLSASSSRIDVDLTPSLVNSLYSAIPASYVGQLLHVSIPLDQFKKDQLNRLGISLNRLTKVVPIQLLSLQNGTSCKFNEIFSFVRDLFEKGAILELTYFAAGTQSQVAADDGFREMHRKVSGSILFSPPSTKHRGTWGLKSPTQPNQNKISLRQVL